MLGSLMRDRVSVNEMLIVASAEISSGKSVPSRAGVPVAESSALTSAPKRSAGLPDVPTCREQGYDVVMEGWTIFIGPKGMTPAQVAYWEGVFRKTVQHEEWKKYLEFNSWEWGYKNAQDTLAYLKKDYEQSRALLTELGLAK